MGLEPASVKLPADAYYARIHPEDLVEVKRAIAAFEAQESELMLEHRILTPDGELRYILEKAKAQRDDFGKLLKVTGYTQDITDLRLGEYLNLQTATLIAEVKMATEQLLSLQELTQSVPLAIQRVADAIQARYAWVFEHRSFENGAGARLVSPTQIGGDLPPEVFEVLQTGNSYAEIGVEDWYEVLRQGGVKKGNADVDDVSSFLKSCKLGRYVVLPIFLEGEYWGFIGFDNMQPGRIWTKNDEGILQGFCNSLGVILSLSAYQANLKAAKELAEHATQTKTNFLSNISHEIRTPMNAIMGLTDLLLPDEKDDERLEYLNAIKFSADNLLRLINDLLDLSKIEANKMTFDRQPFAIKELLRQFKKVMGYLTKEKGLALDFELTDALPNMLSGDAVRLNQILLNLGSNAVKFTEQGYVRFALEVVKESAEVCWLKFTFTDTGIGIAPEKIDLIFDSFEQAEKYISRKFGGTGLGLTITHKLVEMMEGQITVESEMNKGSLFEVLLPFGKVAHDVHNEMRYNVMAEKNLRHKRILIVEDNKINIMLVSRLLKSWQADFEVAENGLEAQERLVAERFDLILLDLQMPVMNGFELMEKLRKGEAGPQTDIPVMALTADAYEQTRGKALSLGFNDFITKPIHANDLYQKIYALTLGQAQF
jgi:signal transduction histidine kinase/ActR/RegA family two-component response regulator